MAIRKQWIQAVTVGVDEETGALLTRLAASVTVKRAKIDASSADAAGNELIAAVAGKRVCVLGLCLMAAEAVAATFFSGPADTGTALSGPMPLGERGGFINPSPADPVMHWLETVAGEELSLLLSVAVQVSGWVVYYEA